jgi:hypothetical protein
MLKIYLTALALTVTAALIARHIRRRRLATFRKGLRSGHAVKVKTRAGYITAEIVRIHPDNIFIEYGNFCFTYVDHKQIYPYEY